MTYTKITIINIFGNVDTVIRRESDKAFIPLNLDNRDYQAYLAWVAEGNTAEEWNPDAD